MGILGGGFYFHNISLPVLANAKNPEKGVRDIFIGYFLVYLTYISCGSLGYYGFMGSTFQNKTWGVPEDLDEIQFVGITQNCLEMFKSTSGWGTFARLSIFLHLVTIDALLFACERAQILLLVTGKQEASS